MTRLLAAILVLCTQVFAVFGTGNVVLCCHETGASAIELAGSACCIEAREHERDASPADGDESGPALKSNADRCRDVPWEQRDTLVARGLHAASKAAHEARASLPATVAWANAAVVSVSVRVAHETSRGPPRDAVPRSARPFVLRC